MRRNRFWVTAVVMWSLAFTQAAAAAHACSILTGPPAHGGPTIVAHAHSTHSGCATGELGPTVNVCESHCFAGQQVYGEPDVSAPASAPQPALIVRVAGVRFPASLAAASLASLAAAPPPQLRFGRFLI